MLDEHSLHYAYLQSSKEATVWTCAFSLCMSPTLQIAVSIRNKCCQFLRAICFMAGVWFHLTAPYIFRVTRSLSFSGIFPVFRKFYRCPENVLFYGIPKCLSFLKGSGKPYFANVKILLLKRPFSQELFIVGTAIFTC